MGVDSELDCSDITQPGLRRGVFASWAGVEDFEAVTVETSFSLRKNKGSLRKEDVKFQSQRSSAKSLSSICTHNAASTVLAPFVGEL